MTIDRGTTLQRLTSSGKNVSRSESIDSSQNMPPLCREAKDQVLVMIKSNFIVVFDDVSERDVRHSIKEHIDQQITALKPNTVKHRKVAPL